MGCRRWLGRWRSGGPTGKTRPGRRSGDPRSSEEGRRCAARRGEHDGDREGVSRFPGRRRSVNGAAGCSGEIGWGRRGAISARKNLGKALVRCARARGSRRGRGERRGLAVLAGDDETWRRYRATPASYCDGLAANSAGKREGKRGGEGGLCSQWLGGVNWGFKCP